MPLLDRRHLRGRRSGRGEGMANPRRLLWPLACLALLLPALASPQDDGFLATLGELREASFSDKERIVERLGEGGHASARSVLAAWLDDRLVGRPSDQRMLILTSAGES